MAECLSTDMEDYSEAREEYAQEDSLELLDTISEAQIAFHLFLNNKFSLAEERVSKLSSRSMYHAQTLNVIKFIKAIMTLDKSDIESSMRIAKTSTALIDGFRQQISVSDSLYALRGYVKPKTDDELHADLCYAESLLIQAGLALCQDESLTSFVKAALKVRACYLTYKSCERALETASEWRGRDRRIYSQFKSGVLLGIGTFNLTLSNLPPRILRLLQVCGFSGDKKLAETSLNACASMEGNIRSPISSLFLLSWHLFFSLFLGCGQPDLVLCRRLIDPLAHNYQNGAIVLLLRARLSLLSGYTFLAISLYNDSINSQSTYRQFHHICYWELLFAHSYLQEWHIAATYAKRLAKESRWSRSIYLYLLAIFFAADQTTNAKKRSETVRVLLEKVDHFRQRLAGKSIPMEKFCVKRAEMGVRAGILHFAHFELLYFMNGFDVMSRQSRILTGVLTEMDAIWASITAPDTNTTALYRFLRAVTLRFLGSLAEAEYNLQLVIDAELVISEMDYLIPNAWVEMGLLRLDEKHFSQAEACLQRAVRFRGFALENKLHFRVHGALERVREEAEAEMAKAKKNSRPSANKNVVILPP